MPRDDSHVAGQRAFDKLNFDLRQPCQRPGRIVALHRLVTSFATEREIKMISALVIDELQTESIQLKFEPRRLATEQLRSLDLCSACNQFQSIAVALLELQRDVGRRVADQRRWQ